MSSFSKLHSFAQKTLENNIVITKQGPFLRAGNRQYSSLWSRDFLYAVPGLLKIQRQDVVVNHILHLVNSSNEDGLIPRILAHRSSAVQVVQWTLFKGFSNLIHPSGETKDWRRYGALKPEIYGEHGTRSLDSGLLLLIRYLENRDLFSEHTDKFQKIFKYYLHQTSDATHLLKQDLYEDWQDSVKRSGEISFCNLLFLIVLKKLTVAKLDWAKNTDIFEKRFFETFWQDSFIFIDHRKKQISLETQLHFLETAHWLNQQGDKSWLEKASANWLSVRNSQLWKIGPGIPVDPVYEKSEASFFASFVGLRHYHDGFLWTWLMAEAARISALYGDTEESQRILMQLEKACAALGKVPEILDKDLRPSETIFFKSELCFSWGAGKCLEALPNY